MAANAASRLETFDRATSNAAFGSGARREGVVFLGRILG